MFILIMILKNVFVTSDTKEKTEKDHALKNNSIQNYINVYI